MYKVIGMSHFAKQLIGEWPVYPGHPVTIAYCIVSAFPTYEDAFKKIDGGYPAALINCNVPGGGSSIHRALDMLRFLRSDTVTVDAILAWADKEWYNETHPESNTLEGQTQADKIKPLLLAKSDWWEKQKLCG